MRVGDTLNIQSNARNINIASFWFNIKSTVITSFLTVYLLRLNANNFQLSLFEVLTAFVGIVSLLAFSIYLDSSKKSFLRFVGLDRLTFIIFAFMLYFVREPLLIIIGFALYCIPYTMASVLSPNFMKDAIPEGQWGNVFSKNKMVLIITNISTLAIVGWLLDILNYSFPYSFIIIFIISGILYAVSYYFLKNIEIEENTQIKLPRLSRLEMLTHVDKNLFLMIFVYAFIYMISPLWNIYHVRILNLNNMQIGLLAIVSSIGGLISLIYWGKMIDKISCQKLFAISTFLMATIPLFYMINKSFYYLLLAQFIIGVISNGFELITQNNLMHYSKLAKYDYAYMSDFQIYQNIVRLGFPALGIMVYSYIGMAATFILIGILRIICAGIIWVMLKGSNEGKIYNNQTAEG